MDLTMDVAQSVELGTPLRIKFAAISERGDLIGDAHDEYQSFFDGLPSNWTANPLAEPIETRTEYLRPGWHLTDGEHDILAVEHETGVEILLVGVLTNVISAGLIKLTTWGWRRWRELRRDSKYEKVNSSLVIEIPRDVTGEQPASLRLLLSPPVSDEDIAQYLRLAASIQDRG